MRRALTAGAISALLAVVPAPASAQSACDRFAEGRVAGRVAAAGLTEISGLAASTVHDGVLWAHDDSDGAPELVALDETGADLGTYAVTGAEARDWEDLATTADGHLLVGDIGDNIDGWPTVTLYRVPEPAEQPDGRGGTLAAEAIDLRYPDGPVNAEALLVDPRDGTVVVLTKEEGRSRVFTAPAGALVAGATVTLTPAGSFDLPEPRGIFDGLAPWNVTGADVAPDGATVVVRTYREVLAYARPDGAPLAAAFATAPCHAPQRDELQGEAIAFVDGGRGYVTVSEGVAPPIHRFDAAAGREQGVRPAPGGGGDRSLLPLAALGGVLLVLAVVVVSRARRSP